MSSHPNQFDASESLQLIRSMIESTKCNLRDSSHYFLLWGWATMLGCLIQFILMDVVHYPHHYLAWLITPVAIVVHFIFIARDRRQQHVKTFIGEANGYLWLSIGLSFVVLACIFVRIGWQYSFPFYILFYGLGTTVSGALLRFKPMVAGGWACFIFAAIAAYLPYDMQILLSALAILVSYIVPGHLLRLRYKRGNRPTAQVAA